VAGKTARPEHQSPLTIHQSLLPPHPHMPNHTIPLMPLRPVQRIAWLDGVRSLECTAGFSGFHPGNHYRIHADLRETATASERENFAGEMECVTTHGREFTVTIYESGTGATGMGRAHHFSDYPPEMLEKSPERLHPFADLLTHFAIPEVPDIAQAFPQEYQRALAWLADFEQRANRILPKDSPLRGEDGIFRLTDYQREDMARAACIPPSLPVSSSPSLLRIQCVERPSLATLCADCFDYVGADEAVAMKGDDSFMSLGIRTLNPRRRLVLTGTPVKNQLHDIFWLLAWASQGGAVLAWEQGLGKSLALIFYGLLCESIKADHPQMAQISADLENYPCARTVTGAVSESALPSPHAGPTACVQPSINLRSSAQSADTIVIRGRHLLVAPEGLHEAIRKTATAFGLTIRTLDSQTTFYSDPELQQWQRDHLAGRESTAEGIWLTSYTQLGMNGADEEIREKPAHVGEVGIGETICYRFNPQIAPISADAKSPHSASGNLRSSAQSADNRFPYPATTAGRAQFAADFMPMEENHSKAIEHEQATGKVKLFRKRVPGLTNRHRLWRILAGLIFRRTSDEVGTMVKLTHVPILLPPGKAQREVYRGYLLEHRDTKDKARLPFRKNVLAIIKNLRVAALAPHSRLLTGMRSWTDACPKQAWTLAKIAQLIADGERIVVLSSFKDFGAALHARLTEAGVASVLLDGDVSAAERARLAEEFKAGHFAVLIGTKASMGVGHSFECAAHLILPDDEYALDLNLQSPKRIHRVNSKRPVTVWRLQTAGTIDLRLAAEREQKTRTAGLALDLDFIPEEMQPLSPSALLREAIADFDEKAPAIDEQTIEDEWERTLRGKLRGAMLKFREHHPQIAPIFTDRKTPASENLRPSAKSADKTSAENVTPREVRTAMGTLRKGRIVDAIPDGTLRFLAKLPAGASTVALRTEFEQFMVNQRDRNWQTAWPKFEAGRKPKRKPPTVKESLTAATNTDRPQPKDYRHLGI